MFKSCDYCRHRKKKCVLLSALTRCTDCQHLDLPCEFSLRQPSLKRRQISKQIVARLGTTDTKISKVSDNSGHSIEEANLREGDCQLPLAGRHDMANKHLFQAKDPVFEHQDTHLSTIQKYRRDVHPFWPFVPAEMLEGIELGQDSQLKNSIDLAFLLSLNSNKEVENISQHTELLVSNLNRDQLSMSIVTSALLLCPFIYLEDRLVEKVFVTIDYEVANSLVSIPPPVISGALLTNVWRRLAGHSHQPLQLSADILQNYSQGLDPATFGHHYLRLSRHATELDQRCSAMEADGIQSDTHLVWSQLEYNCLLWQVCLPPSLLDTRDELPATPESVVVHCLSSLVLLSFYSYVLEHADTLGVLIALQPVPGVLLFMCALARSTFICPRKLLDRMSLLVSIQAQTARIMLRLWHQTNFENCRAILNLWDNHNNRFPDLAQQVREDIGIGPWAVEEIDGYSVFWTFRDLRTLTTKFIFTGRP